MVNRSLLIGFGAGLMFAAGFMFVFPSTENTAKTLTEQQLQAAAELNQMALVPKAEFEKWKKEKQEGEANGLNLPASQAPTSPEVPKPSAAPPTPVQEQQYDQVPSKANEPVAAPVSQPSTTGDTKNTQVKLPSVAKPSQVTNSTDSDAFQTHSTIVKGANNTQTKTETISVTIPDGLTSTEVETILTQAGILPAHNQFVQKITAINKQRSIRAGNYTISKDPNIDQLIQLITTPPAQ